MPQAGIIVYNQDDNSILVGTNSGFGDNGIGYRRTLSSFISFLDETGLFGPPIPLPGPADPPAGVLAVGTVRQHFIVMYDTQFGPGRAQALLGMDIDDRAPGNDYGRALGGSQNMVNRLMNQGFIINNDPFSFIINFILDENFVNNGLNERLHIVNNYSNPGGGAFIPTSCRICNSAGREGFPKGQPQGGEPSHVTALREFYEETGYSLQTFLYGQLAPGAIPAIPVNLPNTCNFPRNILYRIPGQHNGYEYYFIAIDSVTAMNILYSYYGTFNGLPPVAPPGYSIPNLCSIIPQQMYFLPGNRAPPNGACGGAQGSHLGVFSPNWLPYSHANNFTGRRYNSEMFNLRFTNLRPAVLDNGSPDVLTWLTVQNYIFVL